jgi:hypothetical protein
MADAPPLDPSHHLAPPQPAAVDAIADQPRIPAGHSSMRHAHGAERHRGRGRCIRRQSKLSLRTLYSHIKPSHTKLIMPIFLDLGEATRC